MSYEINSNEWYVAIEPFSGVIHHGQANNVRTGMPFMVTGSSQQEVLDLMYSSHTVEDDIPSGTLHEIKWSVGYTQQDAQDVIDDVNSFGYIYVKSIKHPSRDEWAVPYQATVLGSMPAGAVKDGLIAQDAFIVANNRRKTQAEMESDNWV